MTKTITIRLIVEQLLRPNSRKKAHFEAKAVARKKSLSFLFEVIHAIKRQLKPPKTAKVESLLLAEINLTTSSDEDEDYFFTFPNFSRSSKPNLAKTSHPTSELVVSVTVNQEEHLLRALSDTGTSSSTILEAYTSRHLIKNDDENKTLQWMIRSLQINLDL